MKIKIDYVCTRIQFKIFTIVVDSEINCGEVLQIISKKQKDKYISLFLDRRRIDNNKLIKDYLEDDAIFIASNTNNPPNEEFLNDILIRNFQMAAPIQDQLFIYQQDQDIKHYGIKTTSITYQVNDIQYKFYFTGGSKSDFYEGIGVYLKDEMNPSECKAKLESILRENKIDLKNKQLNVCLAGGIPFKSGLLSDVYLNKKQKVKRVIYGILTSIIPDSLLNETFCELCNASDFDHNLLLSPNCKSTKRGLSDIACLLGYLNHGGSKSSELFIGCAKFINFSPMMISMKKIIERNKINGLDILTFCSSFFTFIRNVLPMKICPDNKIFEYTLNVCYFISNESKKSNFVNFPIVKIEDKKDMKSFGPYFCTSDFNENSNSSRFEFNDYKIILNLSDQFNSIFSIPPLSIRYALECSIVRGKDHEYLYLMNSPLKDLKSQNYVQIIDPLTGLVETKELEQFSREQNENDKFSIEPNQIKQIIMFNFDESKYMHEKFNKNSIQFHTAGIQYLTTFVNRNYGYRHPCIQGLVSFNKTIKIKSPFSPFIEDFEEKLLNSIESNSTPKLLDSLLFSCNEIINFRKNKNNGKEMFINARSRIVVISSGKDVKSNSKLDFVVKELLKANIFVDAIILNNSNDDDYDCKLLCSICHVTGGVALKPQNLEDGLSIIEKNSFLNIDERKNNNSPLIPNDRFSRQNRLKPEQITEEFMKKVIENTTIDKNLINIDLLRITENSNRLSTPRFVYERNMNIEMPSLRQRRILKEIRRAVELDDPELKIFIYLANMDIWNVFIKSAEQTSYGLKWWNLNVCFPLFYPIEPPVIKFISIPYHMNVSTEGHICHEILDKSYIPSKSVVDIIEEIKEIFLLPCLISPIRTDAYYLYLTDRDKYDSLAKKSAVSYAKNDYNEFLNQSRIINDNPDFQISPSKHSPPYLTSQITGKPIPRHNLILASSGIYYDKEDLKQLISSNENPICVVTGKILTEKIEDIDNIDYFDGIYDIDLVDENDDTI